MCNNRRLAQFSIAVAGALAALVLSAKGDAQSEPLNPYWIDHISVCRDLCPSMEFENCRCIKLKPIVVVGE